MRFMQTLGCSKLAINWKNDNLRYNLPTWHYLQIFWPCFATLVKFSDWSKFHVNIITGSGVMTIYFYKVLTRDPEIGNTPVWVLSNIWRMGQVRDTKFGTDVSNEILLNAAKYRGYNIYCFCFIKGKPTFYLEIVCNVIREAKYVEGSQLHFD